VSTRGKTNIEGNTRNENQTIDSSKREELVDIFELPHAIDRYFRDESDGRETASLRKSKGKKNLLVKEI
jgi:hypothetical protein